jgi:hypothetical protein
MQNFELSFEMGLQILNADRLTNVSKTHAEGADLFVETFLEVSAANVPRVQSLIMQLLRVVLALDANLLSYTSVTMLLIRAQLLRNVLKIRKGSKFAVVNSDSLETKKQDSVEMYVHMN